jgi:glycolate oxidase iron-sulfur subunit
LKPARLRAAFAIARLLRDSGVPRLLLKTNMPRELSRQFEFGLALLDGSRAKDGHKVDAGKMPAPRPQVAGAPKGAPVLVFKGCVTDGLFARVNEATQRVLEVNKCAPRVPEAQVCCGALHAHAGDLEGARQLARQNIDAFESGTISGSSPPIITNAGGCGAMLVSYAHLLADDPNFADRAKQFSARVRDIGQQLKAIGFRNGASVGYERTTYDASCHLLHGQRAAEASLQMLWAIPDLKFAHLEGSEVCCGGAGVYNLLEPELSRVVLDEKLKHIDESGAEVMATGNPGCHMQIAAGAKLAGLNVRVCHPIELLDESYARAGFYDASPEPQ